MNRILPALLLTAACSSTWTLDDLDGDGVTLLEGDCDDLDATVSPDAEEICDGVDNNCNGTVDNDATEAATWYADEDGDGAGNPERTQVTCDPPEGWVQDASDCDDTNEDRAPGLDEICDDLDNDCNGEVDDEPSDGTTYYEDADDDGYGNDSRPIVACEQPPLTTTAERATDCHDDDPDAFPGSRETEVPGDGIDQDCDGQDACSDFTCDGLPDLVIGTYREDGDTVTEVRVFPGNEERSFGTAATERLPSDTVLDLAAHDLDGDGYQDLVWISGDAEGEGAVTIAQGGADGLSASRLTQLTAYRPSRLRVHDLDGDGDQDLVVASTRNGRLYTTFSYVYVNDGAGVFSGTALPTFGATDVEIADLDQDGWLDLVFCNEQNDFPVRPYETDSSIYWSGTGGADFLPSRVTDIPTVGCKDIAVLNANGDDLPDLAVAQARVGDGSISSESVILLNDDDRFDAPTVRTLNVEAGASVVVADLDGDGLDDPVFGYDGRVTEVWDGSVLGFLSGSGADATADVSLDGEDPRNPALGDYDDDGVIDILVTSFGDFYGTTQTTPTVLWHNDGSGSFSEGPTLPTDGSWRAGVSDFDGDGVPDVVTVNAGEGDSRGPQVAIWYRRGDAYSTDARWTVRMGKVRTLPVMAGRWPAE